MNLIFLTMSQNTDIQTRGIYSDLMRKFKNEGHEVYIVGPCERREGIPTKLYENENLHLLKVRTLNLQKTNLIEKGLGQITLENVFKQAIKKYFSNVRFDLILYSTPPITFCNLVKYLKKRNPQAITYLLLKDIFPQNAVDLKMLKTSGIKGFIYKYFRSKERTLYAISDYIGCMSPANVKYVIEHNPEVDPDKVEEAPNTLETTPVALFEKGDRVIIRRRYKLPEEGTLFLYGGNLGKPQGIPFLLKCLDELKSRTDLHVLIVGSGTESQSLVNWIEMCRPGNVTYIPALPQTDYLDVVRCCDVGLVFLDNRFTIPNFPSRALDYLRFSMPILVASDKNCDMGPIAEQDGYGYWCESSSVSDFIAIVNRMMEADRDIMGKAAHVAFVEKYSIDRTYNAIMNHV